MILERPSKARVIAAFAAVYVIWGSTYLAILYSIETIPPFLMMGVRSVLAGAVLFFWSRKSGTKRTLKKRSVFAVPKHFRTIAAIISDGGA